MRSAVNSGNRITTDGLIFYLDVANSKSYTSGSTNTTDIKSNIVSTLENGVGYDTDNLGSFVFDGVDDYVDCTDNDIFSFGNGLTDSPFSVVMWINMSTVTAFRALSKYINPNREYHISTILTGELRFLLVDGARFQYATTTSDLTAYQNKWVNIVCTYDGRGTDTARNGLEIYVEGVSQSLSRTAQGSGTYVAMDNTTSPLRIGQQDGTNYADGKVSVVQIYNKVLSQSEITRNYNALKYRFI